MHWLKTYIVASKTSTHFSRTFVHGSPERDPEADINSVIPQISKLAMNNQQITDELIALKSALQVMEATLNSIVPKMDESIQESKQLSTEINDKLKEHLNPTVEAKVVDTLISLNTNHQLLAKALGDKVAILAAEIANAREVFSDDVGNSKLINDQIGAMTGRRARGGKDRKSKNIR